MHSEDTPSPPSLLPSPPSHTHLWKSPSFLFHGNRVRLQQVLSRKQRCNRSRSLRAQARKDSPTRTESEEDRGFPWVRVPVKCSRSYFEYFAHTPCFLGASITFQDVVIFSNNTHVITQMVSVSTWLILSTPWPLSSLTSFFNDFFLQPTSLPGSKPSPHPYQQT